MNRKIGEQKRYHYRHQTEELKKSLGGLRG
jgi:hypothetical protein